ncbi:autotransporter domain-containing protein, partial [Nitrospirillum amazonense]|uniref:autotransporter outer membrane beta-barrel domain-containing protein n=1 Tax=Nitrospirillum amazonense TaxID=28077 RepID=UPI002DD4407D
VDAGMTGTANYLVGDSVTLIRGGDGSTYTGATVVSGLTGLDALGATNGSNLAAVAGNDYIGASLATLSVTGTLVNTAGGATALYIAGTGTLGSLANSGVISGNVTNVSARDLTITGGSGTVVGSFTGGTIRNTGANVIFASGAVSLGDAIDVGGTHTVSNIGAAIALTTDVGVNGTYAQSAGSLNVGGHVLTVSGPALVSGGTVSAGVSGVGNYVVGDSVTMIQGGAGSSYTGAVVTSGLTGLDAKGSVNGGNLLAVAGNDYIGASLATLNVTGTLANTAGGATALYIAGTGTLGNLANSGTISGNVVNTSTHDLTINGGGNGAVGRFTGGTITNTGANVVFASGAVSLGDAINVATHTVSNAGASIALASDVAVTGNFTQSSGTLAAGGHVLTVSGAAQVTGGVVNAGVSAVGNYLAGDSVTLIQGGTGSNYAGATVTSGITGLSANAVTSGSNLLAAAGNDYIGASLDTLNNIGTVASPTALYIASTGTLGTLANSGALAGNITNLSTGDLIINGGSATAPGTLTGFNGAIGTISNTGSNVRFTGGVQLLNDHITVGSHTVFNSGATLLVNSAINITGAYSQSAGTLAIGVTSQTSYGNLAVSGAAAFTGGSVLLQGVGSGAGALQAGTYTIASGNGLSLSGVDFTATGYTVTSDLVTVGSTTQLVVKVAGKATNYTAVGNAQGGAAVGTGSALDQIAALAGNSITTNPQVAAFTQQVLAPLATLTPAAKQVAVAQLSPSQLTPQLTATSVTPTTTAISQHQETVASLMDGSEKGMAAGSNGREGVIWGEIVGAGVLRGTTTEAAGYRASSSGLVLGADWFASDKVMAGLAFSWINSASVGQGVMAGSLTRVGSYQLTAYSVWRPDFADQKLSVEGQVGFGYNHFDQRRDIAFLGARANANYGGEQYLGKVTVGYDLPQQGAFTFTPQYSLRFVRLVNHAYQEHDAGPANLKVDVLGTNAVTQELGLKVDTQWNTGVGLLSPDLRVAWVHDFKDGPIPTTGVLAGVAFASTTGRVNTDGLAVNLGATLQQSEAFSLRLEYNGEYRHDYQSHGGVLRASWSF